MRKKEYATELYQDLKARGVRVELDATSNPLSGKIKSAQLEKILWMLVIRKKEAKRDPLLFGIKTVNGSRQFLWIIYTQKF